MMKLIIPLSSITLFFLIACGIHERNMTNVMADNASQANSSYKPHTSIDSLDKQAELHFIEYCSSCHGHGANAFVDRNWKYGSSREAISKSIRDGIEKVGMPAYNTTFTSVELEQLTEYILKGIKDRESYNYENGVTPKYYKAEAHTLQIDTVMKGLTIPWGIKVTADGTIFVTEKSGSLSYKTPEGKIVEVFGVPEVEENIQGGLLDLALHPDFVNNQILYLSYTKPLAEDKTTTAVLMARLAKDKLVDKKEIFEAVPASGENYHYGSRIVFDKHGYLYLSVGDRANRDKNPQFLTNSCGKIHRLKADGSIPKDNPFYNVPDAIKSIWSYGHRNPQGLVYDEETDQLWEHEHGPRGGDELNLIVKGKNYGWPVISYGMNYNGTTFTLLTHKDGMEQPISQWTPSIAPSGMDIVKGDNYGSWRGDILSGSLRFRYISRIERQGGKVVHEERVLTRIGRVRSIEMGADGFLYVGVENPGRVLRITLAK